MRIYSVRYGKYIGDYTIYENRKEFYEKHSDLKLIRWDIDIPAILLTLNPGDWIEAMDGLIVRLLDRWTLTGKTGRKLYVFRFPMSTINLWQTKSGYKTNQFYAGYTFPKKMAERGMKTKIADLTAEDKTFIALLMAGTNPTQAMKYAYKIDRLMRFEQYLYKLENLLNKPQIRNAIMDKLTEVFTGLSDEIPEEKAAKDFADVYNTAKEKNHNLWFQMWKYAVKELGYEKPRTLKTRQGEEPIDDEEADMIESPHQHKFTGTDNAPMTINEMEQTLSYKK